MNERAGADREGRREIQNENGQMLDGTESMDEQSDRESESLILRILYAETMECHSLSSYN